MSHFKPTRTMLYANAAEMYEIIKALAGQDEKIDKQSACTRADYLYGELQRQCLRKLEDKDPRFKVLRKDFNTWATFIKKDSGCKLFSLVELELAIAEYPTTTPEAFLYSEHFTRNSHIEHTAPTASLNYTPGCFSSQPGSTSMVKTG